MTDVRIAASSRFEGCAVGADVSKYQPVIDYDEVALDFITARSSIAGTKDPRYEEHRKGFVQAGRVIFGAYHFAYVEHDPIAEAHRHVDAAGDCSWHSLDVEALHGASLEHVSDWSLAFLEEVERDTRRTPLIYSFREFLKSGLHSWAWRKELARFPLWLADWWHGSPVAIPTPWSAWTFWQTGLATVPGIVGQVDYDLFRGSRAELSDFVVSLSKAA